MLFKNVLVTLGQKWMQLAAIGVIVIFSSMIYTMMFYGLSGIAEPTTTYLADYEQEDFSVEVLSILTTDEAQYPMMRGLVSERVFALTDIARREPATFQRLMDGRIAAFERLYPDVSLELRQVKVVDFERNGRSHTALVARDAERINLSYLEGGRKPARDNEIALNRMYAEKNGIRIGDSFDLLDRRYRVTGFVLLPDYTLPMFDNSFTMDSGLQALALVTDDAWQKVDADASFRLAGIKVTPGDIDTAFDSDQLPFVTQVIPTSVNMRSGAIYDELTQGRTMSLGLSIFIAAIAVLIVSIMMSNLLSAERGQIGILKALGYRRSEVAVPYFVSVVALAFVMLIVGYVLGVFLAEPLKQMYLDFYLLPQADIVQSPVVFATAIFVPLFFFAAFAGAVIYRMLGEGPLALLKPHESDTLNVLTRLASRLLGHAKGRTKFKYLHAIRSTGSFVVFFVGIMFSTLLIMYALMMDGMVDRMTIGQLETVGYRYQAYVDATKRAPDPRPGDEKFLVHPFAYVGDRVVTLHGLAPDNTLFQLHDAAGRNITGRIRDDVVVTESLALKLGLQQGDRLRVRVDDRRLVFTVAGIAHEYAADAIYLDIERLSGIVSDGATTRLYSGIYAIEKPSGQYYSAVISKEGLVDQSRSMATYTNYMINTMIAASAVIAASILFVLTAFTVERNYYSISLLKVLGYSRREVNSMILDSYFVYALASYVLSIPITLAVLDALRRLFLDEYGLVIPFEFDPVDTLRGLAILVVIFLVGTWASRLKIARIPLQEVLKTYGE